MDLSEEIKKHRHVDHPINPLLQNRWSPRAMTGESLDEKVLMSLFEAARWAPSCYNNQPWHFLYATNGSKEWDMFFDLMVEFNQSWAKNASVLVVVVSDKLFRHNKKPNATHSYDTGAAWMSLALEATSRGLVAHGMGGFDYKKAKTVLEIPDDYNVEAMIAIGKRAPKESLPKEIQEKEAPSPRLPLEKIISKGKFKSST